MDSRSFHFNLPKDLIAQRPRSERGASQLMVINPQEGTIEHKPTVTSLLGYVDKETVVIFNNSRVRKARVFGVSSTGSRVEFFFLNLLKGGLWEVLVSKAKSQKVGRKYRLNGDIHIQIVGELGRGVKVIRSEVLLDELFFENYGHIPLPPYIKRDDEDEDRYQNIFARKLGSSASPTAGLHFNEEILSRIKEKASDLLEVTLHVGLGTFEPIRTKTVEEHKMHAEVYSIEKLVAEKINQARADRKKILAIGTTTLRVLESALDEKNQVKSGDGLTDIFIYPGYQFKTVNSLFTNFHITNFHMPNSTLFLLVCAFGGKELVTKAYREAIKREYRFFPTGMLPFLLIIFYQRLELYFSYFYN